MSASTPLDSVLVIQSLFCHRLCSRNAAADHQREYERKDRKSLDDRGGRDRQAEDLRLLLERVYCRGHRASLPDGAEKQCEPGEKADAEQGARILWRDRSRFKVNMTTMP